MQDVFVQLGVFGLGGVFMIEPIMYIGLGFLAASLLALTMFPLVHNRAARLTLRRVEANTPLSMAEIQAHKDQLRAGFAMTARRLEISVEQLNGKTASQLRELGKNAATINRLKTELVEKTAAIFKLEAGNKSLKAQLHAAEEELFNKNGAQVGNALASKLARITTDRDARSTLADSQRIEIVALKTQVDTLKDQLALAQGRLDRSWPANGRVSN